MTDDIDETSREHGDTGQNAEYDDTGNTSTGGDGSDTEASTTEIEMDAVHDALQAIGRPVATADQLAREFDRSQAAVGTALDSLAETPALERLNVSHDPVVYYPAEWGDLARTERVVPFPDRREIVVDQPRQFTRARLSQFARLVTADDGRYLYEIRPEDVWGAPYDSVEQLLETVRAVLPERAPGLESWIVDQWTRAGKFRLYTHKDGYVVLEAESDSLMNNVARPKFEDGDLRAPISDSESWVAEESVATVKRVLYEAGYPVDDDRTLESGDPLAIEVDLELREYQRDWVGRFEDAGSGVLVGPPGSGKTVAAMGVLATVGGETLVLVPSRELAAQWREELLRHTTLSEAQIGEYHGGEKEIRPVTIATYQAAGMDRHRGLFDSREWGLIVFDEAHHVPSPVYRRTADLQSKYRLGLTATPVREAGDETDIYTLIGPPIGTDWDALFKAGYVAEPEVELRYVPWGDADERDEYVSTRGHERRKLAATNSGKVDHVRQLLEDHPDAKTLVFVDYLDQGNAIAEAVDAPFLSGETRHARRERLLSEFRSGRLDTLVVSRVGDEGIDLPEAEVAIVASGLGGSRRQGAQRAGRTMRPAGKAQVYVLATRGTEDEEFARRRSHHLAGKGVRIREVAVEDDAVDGRSSSDSTEDTDGGSLSDSSGGADADASHGAGSEGPSDTPDGHEQP